MGYGMCRWRREFTAVFTLLFIAAAFLMGGCTESCQREMAYDESRRKSESGFEGQYDGRKEGERCGLEDKEHFEKTGALLNGRRPPDPDVPSYVDEEVYRQGFVIGFYEGYDEVFPAAQNIPPVGIEETDWEELDIETDVEIFDEYKLGFNNGEVRGYDAGFDAGLHGTVIEMPEITGRSEDYERGFCDGWAKGYEEGFEQGRYFKEIEEGS
ncbi:MAG: hypothetical protein JW854_11340 [Actinobacteria bacterium]|nr:hypothetical protein [Actinomycetota bacterium]